MKNPIEKRKKIKVLLLCISFLLLIGASHRLSLSLILNEYEEECIQHERNISAEKRLTYGCVEYEKCDYVLCDCLEYDYYNMTMWIDTGKCIKYHLVRKVG